MNKGKISTVEDESIDWLLCGLLRRSPGCTAVSVRKTGALRSSPISGRWDSMRSALLIAALLCSLISAGVTPVGAEGETLQVLNDTAVSLYEQGNYDDAAELAERALKIAEDSMGPDNPEIAPFLNNLAVIYYAQGKYSTAAAMYQRAIRVTEPSLGSDHQRVIYFREGLDKCNQKMSGQEPRKELSGQSDSGDQAALPLSGQSEKVLTPTEAALTTKETTATSVHEGSKVLTVQVGAFRNLLGANKLKERLEKNGYDVSVLSAATSAGDSLHKVQVGEFSERKQAVKLAREIRTLMELDAFVTTK
jgi:tetratricopeptide (TPR) repeat protein